MPEVLGLFSGILQIPGHFALAIGLILTRLAMRITW